MVGNRITRAGVARRALALLTVAASALLLAGCGGGDDSGTTESEQAADAEILNDVLSRQLTAVGVYEEVIPALRGRDRLLALRFRAQEQEHADAVVKALRGLGAVSEPEPEEIEAGELPTRAERLGRLYELEGATIDYELNAIADLASPWPRALLGAIVANQAQHRLVLRQLLDEADPGDPVPYAFEDGTEFGLDERAASGSP
jgi:hypothetical protein